jgi:hypothetical protein
LAASPSTGFKIGAYVYELLNVPVTMPTLKSGEMATIVYLLLKDRKATEAEMIARANEFGYIKRVFTGGGHERQRVKRLL